MSRIGKKPIEIPAGVEVKLNGSVLSVKGPKGELTQQVHPSVTIEQKGTEVHVTVKDPEDKQERSLWGLFRKLISNMVVGVTQGFSKQLEINGVGFRAELKGTNLHLQLGFSHPIDYKIPQGIEIKVEKNLLTVSGFDRQLVGQTAAEIRALKKPEPYKGKGIKYVNETIIRKVGKAAAKGSE
jgi:large subunit ribosomal protein L6